LIYRAAKVFVYPSLFEGFGIPIVEAIASGVPVITSTGSCFSEAGGPDCLYVDPVNPEQLGYAIRSVLSDPDQSRLMTERSRQYIRRFEPDVVATELMRVYRELVQASDR
jgi:glycosyltransferase involved in cell wall biosynthesis